MKKLKFLFIISLFLIVGCDLRVDDSTTCKHRNTEWVEDIDSTCTTYGLKHLECTKCHKILKDEDIEMKSHNFVNNVCTECKIVLEGDAIYQLNDTKDGYIITGINDKKIVSIKLESNIEGLKVFQIKNEVFNNCTNLENVYYDGTIEDWCNITFDSEYSNPMYYANHFYIKNKMQEYEEVKEIVLPDNITKIGKHQFNGFNNVTKVTLPNSIKNIGYEAFNSCSSLDSVYYEGTIEDWCNITFYSSYHSNPMYYANHFYMKDASREYKEVTEIVIPYTVSKIGACQFNGFNNVVSVEIPTSVTEIKNSAFNNCISLKSINWHVIETSNGLFSIGSRAFMNCSSLLNLTIPETVAFISDEAFSNCTNLLSINISKVLVIGDKAFSGCSSLEKIIVDEKNLKYDSRENCNAIIETDTNVLLWGCKNTVIPNTVEHIYDKAFYYCENLINLHIPASVISIGSDAFSPTCNFDKITVDENNPIYDSRENSNALILTKTDELILGCHNTIIPETVKVIGDYAFNNCSKLTSIKIPSGVTNININSFNNCFDLRTVEVDENNPIYDSRENSNAIIETETNTLIFGCQNTVIPNTVITVSENAFLNCQNLTKICIPSSVEQINIDAFLGCINLKYIEVDENNPIYDSRENCNAIIETETNTLILGCQNTIIPNTVKVIGRCSFYGCEGLKEISIPSSVETIEFGAFSFCHNLEEVNLSEGLKEINALSFDFCNNLTRIKIPSTVESLSFDAFFMSNIKVIQILGDETVVYLDTSSSCHNLRLINITNIENLKLSIFPPCPNVVIRCKQEKPDYLENDWLNDYVVIWGYDWK